MYIDTVPNRNSRPAILLREGWREGKRVRKRTIANLSKWPPDKIQRLRLVLKNVPLVHPDELFVIERSLPHGHVEMVLKAIRRLKLPTLINPKPSRQRNLVLALIIQRLLHPASKLATTRLWHTTTLASELSLEDADEDDLYGAMDWLLERQNRIEKKLARRHLAEGDHVLYDVSSSYYEGHTCSLMQYGHSRDGKRGRPIVVYGMMADAAGCPVAVQAYPGNTGDPVTVPDQVEKLRQRFERVVLVGDRGLLTGLRSSICIRGWAGSRPCAMRPFARFNPRSLTSVTAEIRTEAYERLVVCYNPMLAEYRRNKRQDLVAETEKKLARAREVARWTKTPLLATQIALKVGRIKNRYKVAKHLAGDRRRALRIRSAHRSHRPRGATGRILHPAHQRTRRPVGDARRGAQLQEPDERGAGLPLTQDGGLADPSHPSPGRDAGAVAPVPVPAGLLCPVASQPWPRCCSDEAGRAPRWDPVLKAEPYRPNERRRSGEDGLPLLTLGGDRRVPVTSAELRCRTRTVRGCNIDGTDAAAATGAGVGQFPVDN